MGIEEIKRYLHKIRLYALFSALFFIFSTYEGFFLAQNYPNEVQDVIRNLNSMFLPAKEMTSFEIFLFILENNVIKLFFVLILSVVGGISSLLALFSNGFILGVVSEFIAEEKSWKYLLAGILPHGIPELTAFILSAAAGLRIGKTAIWKLFGKKVSLTNEFSEGLKFYVLVLTPMLIAAALIEAYITPVVLSFFS